VVEIKVYVKNPNAFILYEPKKYGAQYDYYCFIDLLERLLFRCLVREIIIEIKDGEDYEAEAIETLRE